MWLCEDNDRIALHSVTATDICAWLWSSDPVINSLVPGLSSVMYTQLPTYQLQVILYIHKFRAQLHREVYIRLYVQRQSIKASHSGARTWSTHFYLPLKPPTMHWIPSLSNASDCASEMWTNAHYACNATLYYALYCMHWLEHQRVITAGGGTLSLHAQCSILINITASASNTNVSAHLSTFILQVQLRIGGLEGPA